MLPYLITLSISVLLIYFAEAVELQYKGRFFSLLLVSAALFLPCALAGGRDMEIGIDTAAYGAPLFEIANQGHPFDSYLEYVEMTNFDINILFSALAYLMADLTHSTFWYLFAIQALMLIPFYIASRVMTGNRYVWISILAYYILFYLVDYSALRQNIAVSFIALGFVLFAKRRLPLALICYALAVGFHSSALVWIVIPVLWCLLFNGRQLKKHAKPIAAIVVVSAVLVALNIETVFDILTSNPLLSRYASYLNTDEGSSFISFYPCFAFMLYAILNLARGLEGEKRQVAMFLVLIAFLSFPIWAMQSFNRQFTRLGFYAWIFFPLALSYSLASNKRLSAVRVPLRFDVFVYFLGEVAYCGWVYIIQDSYKTIPYTSSLFGIS